MTTTLHYFYDPLCGWCYGAAPLLRAARAIVTVHPHGGGMMTGAQRQSITPQLRAYVGQHDARIAQLTGQPFGPAYRDGLLNDSGAVLDSEPPTVAILAAEDLAGRGLDMLARLQIAHYVEGRRIAEPDVLLEVATSLGLDPARFTAAFDRLSGEAVQAHFRQTRAQMAQLGAQGFPTLVLQSGDEWQVVDVAAYLSRPDAFADWLRSRITAPATRPDGETFRCDDNGCAI
jgi:putative protein-disulfide isomerase